MVHICWSGFWSCIHACQATVWRERIIFVSWFSLPAIWFPEIQVRCVDLVASSFNHYAISPAQILLFKLMKIWKYLWVTAVTKQYFLFRSSSDLFHDLIFLSLCVSVWIFANEYICHERPEEGIISPRARVTYRQLRAIWCRCWEPLKSYVCS